MIKRLVISLILSTVTIMGLKAELTVSLLTLSPGHDIYELQGHNNLHFHDPDQGIDMVVSWGVFDFNSPNFVYRFVKGETDYLAAAYDYNYFMQSLQTEGRRVVSQQLNLSPQEAQRLLELTLINLQPQNRVYRYNYVKDNCATRPMEMIERAIGSQLTFTSTPPEGATWRSEMTSYHVNYPWYQLGIDMALGSGIDKPLTAREACYAPATLQEYMSTALRPDGNPIVRQPATVLLPGNSLGQPAPPTPWYISPMATALVIMFITAWATMWGVRHHRIPRFWYSVLYIMALTGSLVLTFLIFFSTHEATSPNWLYLWLNPLTAIGLVGLWLKKCNIMVYYYQIVNFVALLTLIVVGLSDLQHLNQACYPLMVSFMATSALYIYIYRYQQHNSR